MNKQTETNIASVLSIAGSDCSGMAGIQSDLRTIVALGAHPLTAITANTAQGTDGVLSVNPVSAQVLRDQLSAVRSLDIKAVKSGVLCNAEQVSIIADFVKSTDAQCVVDPVFSATSGSSFSKSCAVDAFISLLLPLCTLITPNLSEAEQLTGLKIQRAEDVEKAAKRLQEFGAKNVLVKGGHASNADSSQDYFCGAERQFWLSSPWIKTTNMRGTGCALSSAIATALAQDQRLEDAVVIGKMAINQGLRQSYAVPVALDSECIDSAPGPIYIDQFPNQQIDLPMLSESSDIDLGVASFPCCDEESPLGLYPCVDSADWIRRLTEAGVTTIQLRNKTLCGEELEQEIIQSIQYAKANNARLFINDHWELAIKHGAYGVHLGQEDLDSANVKAIRDAGLRLGISTHCHYEVARAHAYKPSYIACGPVYHTTTKQMPWIPHALDGLDYWNEVLNYPVVGIGGIHQDRVAGVAATGVSGIAMITAITLADDPEQVTREMIETIQRAQSDQWQSN